MGPFKERRDIAYLKGKGDNFGSSSIVAGLEGSDVDIRQVRKEVAGAEIRNKKLIKCSCPQNRDG